MKLVDPIPGVGEKELTYWTGMLAVKVDGFAPVGGITVGKIFWGELHEVVPVRSEVVVDHIEDHSEPQCVRLIDETATSVGGAVELCWRKEIDTIIAPAEAARKVCHWHDLEQGHARIRQLW